MNSRVRSLALCAAVALTLGRAAPVAGQPSEAGQPPPSARDIAPADLTGYWVSYVNKEWRFRMVTPAKGDFRGEFGGIPMTAEAREIAENWDPARDEAAGEACRAYGAAGVMRVPGRLHITWEDDDTLRVDTDAGMQTRLLRFADDADAGDKAPTWQGHSEARWIFPAMLRGRVAGPDRTGEAGSVGAQPGSLEVVTTRMRPGYLRRNGIPYSEQTRMTEYWDLFREPDGNDWLVLTTVIEDPRYLRTTYFTTPAFRRERNGAGWNPVECSAR